MSQQSRRKVTVRVVPSSGSDEDVSSSSAAAAQDRENDSKISFIKTNDNDKFENFKLEEKRRRDRFDDAHKNDIFLSHCWRGKNESISERKWSLVELLTRPADAEEKGGGYRAWWDYLDLQAKGPVAWRREIEEGILNAGKVVCFVDVPYLHSFNCLQEVAMAQRMGKPIIFVVLEKPAQEIITSADHGAKVRVPRCIRFDEGC